MKYRLGLAISAALCFGCGGGGGGAVKPAATPVQAAPAQSDALTAEQPALTPVSAPEGLIAVGRVKSAAAVLDHLVSWTGMPVDWRQKLETEEPDIAHAVALDAPIEAAVSLPVRHRSTEVPAVVSVGLKSVEAAVGAARHAGLTVTKLGATQYRVEGRDLDYCVVGPALGAAPARLVCGKNAAAFEALGPYALRGLPRESLPDADLHIELRAGPARRAYGAELRQLKMLVPLALHEIKLDNPRFDRAVADALHALADELPDLVNDLDRISLDVNLSDQSQSLDVSGKLALSGQQSWFSKTLQDAGAHAAQAPDVFWKMPADCTAGSYGTSSASKSTEALRQTLAEMLAGYLESVNVAPKLRDDLTRALLAVTSVDGTRAAGAGAVPAAKAKSGNKATFAERTRAVVGWRLLVEPGKPDSYRDLFAALSNLVEDKALRKRVADLAHVGVDLLPHVRSRKAAGLGTGATEYELAISAKAAEAIASAPAEPVSVYAVVAPLGDASVIGVSAAKEELYARIKKFRDGQGPTLTERQGLDGLKTTRVVGAGFLTLEGLLQSDPSQSERDTLLTGLPHGGKTPMLFWSSVESSAAGPTSSVRLSVPKDVFSDVVAAALAGLMDFGSKAKQSRN